MNIFRNFVLIIFISSPFYSFSQSSIENNHIGGIKLGMAISTVKKVFPSYKFKEYEPDGNGAGDWKNQEVGISSLEIFKPNNQPAIYSISIQDKKATIIDYTSTDFKTKEGIGVGSTLADLNTAFPKMYIGLIGGFDNITQKESVVITAAFSEYPNLQFEIESTPELDKMDIDKIDRTKLLSSLKVHKISLVGDGVNKQIFDASNLLVSNKAESPKQEDRHATFPGGDKALGTFMRGIHYPQSAIDKNIQGTVWIKFTVDETGKIVDPSAVTHLGGGLEEEGLRLVKSMPNWLPAIKDGNPVKEEYNMPFKFSRQR